MNTNSKLWNRNFILMSVAALLTFMSFYFLLPTLPVFLRTQFGAENRVIGVLLGTFTIATVAVRPLFGYLLDNGKKRFLYLLSISTFAIFSFGYAFVPSLAMLFLLRLLHGATWGGTTITGSSIVVDFIPPDRRGEGIGYFGLSMTLAMAFGPLAATTLFSEHDFTKLFLSAGVIAALAFLFALGVRFSPNTTQREKSKPTLDTFVERRVLPVSFNMTIMTIGYGGLLSFVPLYAKEIGANNPGIFFLMFAAGLGGARILAGKSYDKLGPKPAGVTSFITMTIGFVALALWKNVAGFLVAAVILGFSQGLMTPTFQAMVNDLVPPTRRGAANSTYFTSFDVGIGVGMISIGIMGDSIGLANSFLICAALCVAGLATFVLSTIPHFNNNCLRQ